MRTRARLQSTLWRRYGAVMSALLVAVMLAVGGTEMVLSYQAALRDTRSAQDRTANEVAQAIRLALGSVERHLGTVAALPWEHGQWLGMDQRREEFHRLLLLVPALVELRLLDGQGALRLRVSRMDPDVIVPAAAAASAPAPAAAQASAPAPGEPKPRYGHVEYVEGYDPRVQMSLQIRDRTAGQTEATLGLRGLSRELGQALLSPELDIYAIDSRGRVVLHAELAVMLAQRQWAAPDAVGRGNGLNGKPVLSVQQPVPSMDWRVVVDRPLDDALAPVWRALWRVAGFTLLGVLAALGAALVLARRMTRPIAALQVAAHRLGRGDLAARINLHTGDELEDLGEQFNRMATSLQASVTELEDKVAAKTMDLQRANRHKSEFLANMSHELRTPLNAVLGFADILGGGMVGPLNDEQREFVADIHASGLHLLALINDVLDVSRIEAGQLGLERSDFDVAEVVEAAAALVRQRCLHKGLALMLHVPPEAAVWHADARRFKQVVLNLLNNAVKFTPEGGQVSLRAGVNATEGLWVEVQDTGIGIAPADHAAVFDEFRQVGADAAGRAEGSGLGLTLVQRLVAQHGGRVTLASALGQGATFRFNMPPHVAPPTGPPTPPHVAPDVSPDVSPDDPGGAHAQP